MNVLVAFLYDLGVEFKKHEFIHELSMGTYEEHLDKDKSVVFYGKAEGKDKRARYGQMLLDVFNRIHGLWLEGHNLLVVDSDTLCVKPTPFPSHPRLTMYNMGNCAAHGQIPRDAYLHAGVRYIPANLPDDIWAVGFEAAYQWDMGKWAYDQYIWNCMFWAQQGVKTSRAEEYVDPRMCWIPLTDYDNLGVPRDEAHIIHYGETRGLDNTIRKMTRDARVCLSERHA